MNVKIVFSRSQISTTNLVDGRELLCKFDVAKLITINKMTNQVRQ